MDLAIFSPGGGFMLLRWIHFLAGVVWIGLLYYFNFVQGSFMAEADGPAKSTVTQKLVPRALWWFRWGAMFTFISGILMMGLYRIMGTAIIVGSTLGILMFLNVWLIIWPNQKVVIKNAEDVAQGKPANPAAAVSAAKATLASRTNTMFSLPMLFFMGASTHFPIILTPERSGLTLGLVMALVAALEANAIFGKLGPLTKVKGVIHSGIALTVVLYLILQFGASN
ncbi:MAG: urate hydroxylase PuuD [Oligoflexia bacterium]|nr:urate hydroxylase PuuD [Oligoflexia bacterium]